MLNAAVAAVAAIAAVLLQAPEMGPPQAPTRTQPPSIERIVNAVFENLTAKIYDIGGSDKDSPEAYTVLDWVRKAQVELAEDEAFQPKHSWSRAECKPELVDVGFIDFHRELGYSSRLFPRLEKLRGRYVWHCSLAWGYGWGDDTGEVWWHHEVMFMLADETGHPVIPDSFVRNYTP